MGKNSKIEWTDHTFNPWIGCTRVSAGCANCYAETLMDKRWKRVKWGKGQPRVKTSDSTWKQVYKWDEHCRLNKIRERVFCASLADVFDPEVSDDWRQDLMETIYETPNLDWLLLTKRPETARWCPEILKMKNVNLGISAENQECLDARMEIASDLQERIWVSAEPLLGPLDLNRWRFDIDWIIVGGESGPGARMLHPQWVIDIRDECVERGISFFFKQWGEFAPDGTVEFHGDHFDIFMERVGKKEAGRVLQGREWNQTRFTR